MWVGFSTREISLCEYILREGKKPSVSYVSLLASQLPAAAAAGPAGKLLAAGSLALYLAEKSQKTTVFTRQPSL